MSKWFAGLLAVFLLLLLFTSSALHAQDVSALTGIVTDPSGAAVSDARVTLTDTRTGEKFETKTGADGSYRFPKVQPGPGYTLNVVKDGFEAVTVSNLYLAIGTTRTQNIQLPVGTVSQTVEVKSEGSVSLDTTDSTIGNNIDIRAVESLPNEFRDNPGQLLRLEPGVVSAQGLLVNGVNPADPSGSRDGAVAGARADQNNITVDGIDATDFATGQAFAVQASIPLDAVQEFNTQVAGPTSAYGRGSGAQTIIITKSGTNEWHGSASEYNRTAATEANSFFNKEANPIVPRAALVRNQFGAELGGPAIKDKLFFYFDYEGRRDNQAISQTQIVPLPHVQKGEIAYINAKSTVTGQPCSPSSRLTAADVSTDCVTILPAAQVNALDPCNAAGNPCASTPGFTTPGFNPAVLQLFNSRYPAANQLSLGDGLNTGGLVFNAPNNLTENIYTTRVDYNINSKHKFFTRFNFNNANSVNIPIQFPGDPSTGPLIVNDNAFVVGETWTKSATFVNQLLYGETRTGFNAPVTFNGNGLDFPLNWFGAGLSIPFARQSTQSGIRPIPTLRDDVTLLRGKHSLQFGGEFKPIKLRSTLGNSFNFISEGLGSHISTLTPNLQPANLLTPAVLNPATGKPVDPTGVAEANWNNFFAGALGILNEDQTGFIYEKNGTALPLGAVERRDYRYYDYAAYLQDSWKVRSDLTIAAGIRYQYDSTPYEVNGLEATFANTNINNLFAVRTANGLNGISGPNATPQLTYQLAGNSNAGGPQLYHPDKFDFSPRLGIAWNPGFHNGLLGRVLGDHKTVIRLGASLIFDQTVINAVNFVQDQASYLFGNTVAQLFGTSGDPTTSLKQAPRYTGPTTIPFTFTAPPFQNPLTPNAIFNYAIDPTLKTPYSEVFSAGVQRSLPGGFQLEVDYYGRFGHRLFTFSDAAQPVNFIDPTSKQDLFGAITNLELASRQNVSVANVPTQQFFENQVAAAIGASCPALNAAAHLPFTTCTQFVYANNILNLQQGNLGSVLLGTPLLPNVGLPSQFLVNALASNKGFSAYNGLLVVLRKRLSHNLQFDFDYTFSHSIDNASAIANNNGNFVAGAYTIMCDPINLSVCRGNSEFDATHQVSSNFVYDLPIGRGQAIARNSARWLDEIIGGWQVSGIVTFRTGLAFPVESGVSTTSLAADNGALFTGTQSAVSSHIHADPNNPTQIQFFSNPTAALAAFSPVTGLEVGNRDTLRGPHFSNLDLGVGKNFPLFKERYRLQFRAEAFNAFNHVNFGLPNVNINTNTFGVISAAAGQNPFRVLQGSLRFQF